MHAIARIDFPEGGEGHPVFKNLAEGIHTILEDKETEERREAERVSRIQLGLLDLYNLDSANVSSLTYETGNLKRRQNGVDVPEAGALLTHTDVMLRDGTKLSFTALVDAKTRIDERLATDLGFEADRDAANGDYYSDVITPESDTYYEAARTETELYRIAQLARATGAIALLMPQNEEPSAEVIPIWPGAQDAQPFGGNVAV